MLRKKGQLIPENGTRNNCQLNKKGQLIPENGTRNNCQLNKKGQLIPENGTRNNCQLNKKGQLTTMIIVAVVIVVIIIGFYIVQNASVSNAGENEKIGALRETTLDCFNNVYYNSLLMIGLSGGYSEVDDGIYNGFVNVPYYYNQGRLNVPTKEKVEDEIEKFVDLSIKECIDYEENIVDSEELGIQLNKLDLLEEDYQGYELSYDDYKTDVIIEEGRVLFETDLTLNVVDDNKRSYRINFKDYPKEIESDIYSMHKIASYIATSLKENNEELCLTCVYEMGTENGLNVELMGYLTDEVELVVITNNVTSVPFIFQNVNKFNVKEDNNETLF